MKGGKVCFYGEVPLCNPCNPFFAAKYRGVFATLSPPHFSVPTPSIEIAPSESNRSIGIEPSFLEEHIQMAHQTGN
jgi:hypothetical protein